jgi:hypothetical protein
VAVVSTLSFYDHPVWRTLPDVIAGSSHIRATIVVATQVDTFTDSTAGDKERETVRKGIIRQFWPESIADPSKAGVYLECSAQYGESMEILDETLGPLTVKPQLSDLRKGDTESVSELGNIWESN